MASPRPTETPHTHPPESTLALLAPWTVLAWSAVAIGLGLGWLAGVLPRGVPEHDGFGSLFIGQSLAVASGAVIACGALGAVAALLMMRRGAALGRTAEVLGWVMAAAVLLVFVDGSLLAFLGYSMMLPVVGWFVPGLFALWLEAALEPTSLTLFFFALGVGLWTAAALVHRRAVRGACVRCGRDEDWTGRTERRTRERALRLGRGAVAAGVVLALLYPMIRFPWLVGVFPGMSSSSAQQIIADTGTVSVGVGLGSAGAAGAVLMLGLVQRWGVRFPRWMVGLAGRRVPVSLAVVPATLVAVALVAMGRSVAVQLFTIPGALGGDGLHMAVFSAMPLWGAALAVATAAYAVRRRAECAQCGRGLPEAEPGRSPAAAV
jgi:predicted RecA/RadA family phage recombinase